MCVYTPFCFFFLPRQLVSSFHPITLCLLFSSALYLTHLFSLPSFYARKRCQAIQCGLDEKVVTEILWTPSRPLNFDTTYFRYHLFSRPLASISAAQYSTGQYSAVHTVQCVPLFVPILCAATPHRTVQTLRTKRSRAIQLVNGIWWRGLQ